VSFHLPIPRVGDTRNPSALSLEDATLWESVPFSHHSASRIFITRPDCTLSPVVTQDGDHQLLDGRSKPGCGPRLSLNFKDAYHPCWGGERGEPGLYLPHGSAGHLLFQLLVVETIPQLCGGGVLQPCRGRRNVAADDATPGGCSPRGRVGLCRGKADPSLMTKTLRGSEVYEQLESILRVEAT
jgi:hypothetical protein